MSFKLPAGPGRPVGSVNKISKRFGDTMSKHGFDIAEELLDRYNEALADGKQELCVKILCEMAQYVYPKLKSVEQVRNSAIDGMTTEQQIEAFKKALAFLESKDGT